MTPTGALFILKDIAFDRKMYDSLDGSLLSWEGSDLRRELNTVELANLPDDLAAEITPRKITQVIAGGSITTEDKLWVPSATELFGKGHRYAACDGPDEEQLPIFKTEGDRVKDMDGETWWYWLRSPPCPRPPRTSALCTTAAARSAPSPRARVAWPSAS